MNKPTDISDISSVDSVVRQLIEKEQTEQLSDFSLPEFVVPCDHKIILINISPIATTRAEYSNEITKAIEPIINDATKNNVPQNFKQALYEAVLNAHEHGNKLNYTKRIKVSYNVSKPIAEFTVTDEGNEIKTSFLSYILSKQQIISENYTNFYDFSRDAKPKNNHGIGISQMYTYSDDVKYFKSKTGGLTAFMTRRKSA